MLVLSDHIHFIYVLFYFLSLFIFFIYFLDVITSKTVISRQKMTISEETPVRIFQNISRFISAVSTVSFFLSVEIWGDIWHIFKILYLLFCSIYSRLSCSLVIFCVRHYLFLALWFWTVLNGSSVFGILFILFLRSKVSSPSASFCPWDQSSWRGSWQFNFLCRCDERPDCSLNASLDIRLESDPCPNTEKYLEAHYVCHSLSEGPPTQGWSAEKLVKLHSDNLSSVMWCHSPVTLITTPTSHTSVIRTTNTRP